MKKINILLTCFMFASMLLSAQRMYWTDGISSIYSANLDGTDQKTILSGRIRHLSEFALDTINRKIYWIDWRLNIIGSANLDWTALEILLNLEYKPSNIIVDADNEKIYWQSNNGRQLHRANLNGKGEEVVIPAGTMVYSDLTLDGLSNTIYWFNTTTWKIQSANLDGTDVQDIVTLVPRGTYSNLAVDIANNQLFWVSRNNEGDGAMSAMRLWTRRLDRAGERVLTGIGGMFPYLNFALDVSNKQIFVSSTGDERSGFHFSVHDYTGAQKQIIPAPLAIHMPNMIFDERSFALYHIGTAGSPINKTSLKGQAPAYELKSEPVVKEKIINPP